MGRRYSMGIQLPEVTDELLEPIFDEEFFDTLFEEIMEERKSNSIKHTKALSLTG